MSKLLGRQRVRDLLLGLGLLCATLALMLEYLEMSTVGRGIWQEK